MQHTKKAGENKAQRISNPFRRLLNLKDAAEFLGRTVWGVRTLIWNGKIPYIQEQTGGKIWIDINDLEKYIEKEKRTMI